MNPCADGNHVIGYHYEIHEGALPVETVGDIKLDSDWDDTFNFCPYCGVALEEST